MYTENRFSGCLTLIISMIFLAGTVSAYSIDPLDKPYSVSTVSELSDSARMVNLTDNGDAVTEEDISDGFDFYYNYNATSQEEIEMAHLSEGYWYSDIQPEMSRGSVINYTLEETTGTEDNFYTTEDLEFGNYSVELVSETGTTLPPGETTTVRVNVTDEWNDEPETGATANIYFTNGTHTHKIQDLGNQEGSQYFNGFVDIPDNFGGNYLMHINVTNSGDSIDNPSGSLSIPVTTEPPMQGDITEFESAGCVWAIDTATCERNADISTEYEVTGEEPTNVNFTIREWNNSEGEWQYRSSREMAEEGNTYSTDLTFPDLNTTLHEKLQFVYNATGEETEAVERMNVSVADYDIRFGASSSARQGGSYGFELAFEKPYSARTVPREGMEANITVYNDSLLTSDSLRNLTLEDMEYDEGVFSRDIEIGSDWPEKTYSIAVEASNQYGLERTGFDTFFVEDVNRTFNISGDIEETVITGKNYSYNFTVENLGSSRLELEANATEELEGFTWVNGTSNVFVPGDETVNVTAKFNMTEVVERDGEIVLSDDAYNDSIDVDLDLPNCDHRNGTICVEREEDLNVSADENGDIDRLFRVYYLADENESINITPEVTGNISSFTSVDPDTVELNSSNNQHLLDLNYTVSGPGYYTGTVDIEDVSVPIELDSEAESQSIQFSVNSSVDLGMITGSNTVNREIELENTASTPIDTVSFSSDQMSVEAESIGLEAGETEWLELEFSDVSSSGSVDVTATSDELTATETVDVTADVVPNYAEQAQSLQDRINSLQSQAVSNENLNKLSTASLNATEAENAYNAGNYEKAERIYEATEEQVNLVESRANTGGASPGGSQSEGPGSDTQNPTTTNQDGGIGMILIIAVVVFVLLFIGFIAYTSLIPEEGDPLYKVLGR
ncbi:MAG: hypothetical protein ACI8Z7_000625 [Candidatus Nanohaloarchaea archaeon]|jgi:hypothetical protein